MILKRFFLFSLPSLLSLLFLSSCLYRMPEEDELHVVPTTNNPDVTRQQGVNEWAPGIDL